MQGLISLSGEWEVGVGSGGEHPGVIKDIMSGKKIIAEILSILRLPFHQREIIPITIICKSGRVIRATTLTTTLSESAGVRTMTKVVALLDL